MPDTFRDILLAHISEIETELSAAKAALSAYDRKATTAGDPADHAGQAPEAKPYARVRPFNAIVSILEAARGGRMNREALMQELVSGGALEGKKRGLHNLRISIDLNAKMGKLRLDGDDVILTDEGREAKGH